MKIKTLSYRDNARKWYFEDINFFDLTLLVGASGVGKTQILSAILNLQKIALGRSLSGIEWQVLFEKKGNTYFWKGKYEILKGYDSSLLSEAFLQTFGEEQPKIEYEFLYLNGELILSREGEQILFHDKKLPKLSLNESLITLFKEEEEVKSAHEAFRNIIFRDHTLKAPVYGFSGLGDFNKILLKYRTIEDIRNSNLDTVSKLYCLYMNDNSTFNQILENYIDVFPQVERIKVEPFEHQEINNDLPVIQFKEKEVDRWISSNEISSGMIRTFLHIAEMYLLKDGTVVLIDEFENSLGVNCINVLTEDLIYENGRLQFIATSHHPYIINKIPYNYWKIITRKGGEIKTYDAKDFNLGASNHERFLNLVNLPQYKRGIESLI